MCLTLDTHRPDVRRRGLIAGYGQFSMGPPACVIVGVDASRASVAALEWALKLAGELRCRILAVHAIGLLEEGGYRARPDMAEIVDRAIKRACLIAGFPVERIEEDGPPADVIVRVAERENADLIVVGSRGLGQASRLLGSTSEAVLAHAHLPVVVVPSSTSGDDVSSEPPADRLARQRYP